MSSKYRVYPEYKDSGVEWLGDVPNHWDEVRLKYVASLIVEKIEAGSTQIYIGLENIQPGNGKYLAKEDMNPEGLSTAFYQGDVLFGKLRPYLSKSWLADFSGICSSEFLVLRSRKVCSKFLSYYTLMGEFVNQVDSSTYGSKMPRASWDFISLMAVPVPLQEESVKIANFLDHETAKIDTLIDKQQQLIALLKEKRQAVISHAVTKGLNTDALMKDSEVEWLGEVPEHWKVLSLKHLVSIPIIDGPHESPVKYDEGVPFVSAEAISKGYIDFDKIWGYISKQDNEKYSKRYSPERDDILMVKLGATTGAVAMVTTDAQFNIWVPLAAVRINERALSKYVFYSLGSNSVQNAIQVSWTYGTQQTLGLQTLGNIRLALPAIQEQSKIIDYLDSILPSLEASIVKCGQSLCLLSERRTALISAAVTGKIDVRDWQPPTEPQAEKDTP